MLLGLGHLNGREQGTAREIASRLVGDGSNIGGSNGARAAGRETDNGAVPIDHGSPELSQSEGLAQSQRPGGWSIGNLSAPGLRVHRNVQYRESAGCVVRDDTHPARHTLSARQHDNNRVRATYGQVRGQEKIGSHKPTHSTILGETKVVRFNTAYQSQTGVGRAVRQDGIRRDRGLNLGLLSRRPHRDHDRRSNVSGPRFDLSDAGRQRRDGGVVRHVPIEGHAGHGQIVGDPGELHRGRDRVAARVEQRGEDGPLLTDLEVEVGGQYLNFHHLGGGRSRHGAQRHDKARQNPANPVHETTSKSESLWGL